MAIWQVQDAKARLSELIERAHSERDTGRPVEL
jgi:hypothetical protein